jgi:hypothetical protein
LQTLGVPFAASATTPARRRPRPGRVEATEDVGSSNHNWRVEFTAAADTFQWDDLHVLSTRYVQEINGHTSLESEKAREVRDVLDILRTNLRYEDLELVADAALAHNPSGAAVRRLYAQALVDGHNPALALTHLRRGGARPSPQHQKIASTPAVASAAATKICFLTCTDQHRRHRYLVSFDRFLPSRLQTTPPVLSRHQRRGDARPRRARGHRAGRHPPAAPRPQRFSALVNDALADDGWGS